IFTHKALTRSHQTLSKAMSGIFKPKSHAHYRGSQNAIHDVIQTCTNGSSNGIPCRHHRRAIKHYLTRSLWVYLSYSIQTYSKTGTFRPRR
ncbi:hypothetical protein, partial [Enterobacter cloacae]|uniref:hypothetical protein n=1 Tax=Enterobacter cloacae TaxID=550 RepID=UPI001C67F623